FAAVRPAHLWTRGTPRRRGRPVWHRRRPDRDPGPWPALWHGPAARTGHLAGDDRAERADRILAIPQARRYRAEDSYRAWLVRGACHLRFGKVRHVDRRGTATPHLRRFHD